MWCSCRCNDVSIVLRLCDHDISLEGLSVERLNIVVCAVVLERDANKQYVLRITNPQLFWSTSKYLVVLVS